MLCMYINSLGRDSLVLNVVVYNSASSGLGNIIDSSSFAMIAFVGPSFLDRAHSLDVCTDTL